eukprot:TRINITY_DN105100_c0_g1_i1.p2 TRINITY_DN105100_c0_g1~~TRINITY_DN105100_c0_g1_i1.p2  ORF type:complete len:118 (+),score=9.91 TRINITY_DN105100_c0_g1_i1:1-354(+)
MNHSQFQACGNVKHLIVPPAANCNWVYLQYESVEGAQRALQRNGSKLGVLSMMVGVQPPSLQARQLFSQHVGGVWASPGMQTALPERYNSAPDELSPVPVSLPRTWWQWASELAFGA